MHRIDGPGATVDNKFTDGDPVGGIQATLVTDDWLNDVQENIMAVLDAASVAPVKGQIDQLLLAIRGVVKATKSLARFTASGSFTVPAGVTTIYASGCAAGGGGGSSLATNSTLFVTGGSGGGAGQPAIRVPITVTPGQVIPVTIGAGGNGGTPAANNATAGGSTQLGAEGALLNLLGGAKGLIGTGGTTVPGNYGGPAGGVGFPNGGYAQDTSAYAGGVASGGFGGVGGSTPFGDSGSPGRGASGSSLSASSGFGFGAGGSGAGGAYNSTVSAPGGAGAAGLPGLLIIEW